MRTVLLVLLTGLVVSQQEARNPAVVREFERLTGYPHGRPGYVVDHRIPLCAGGPDTVSNLQWQEQKASYVKDLFERDLCRAMKEEGYILVKKPQ